MIDRSWIGREVGRTDFTIEAGRLRFFAKAIGETDPIYFDEAAARAAGYSALPAPPTFLFGIELDSGSRFQMLSDMGVPLARILHGEQGFEYLLPLVAGDVVDVISTVSNIYEKKGGLLEFVEVSSAILTSEGALAARLRTVTVVRN